MAIAPSMFAPYLALQMLTNNALDLNEKNHPRIIMKRSLSSG